MLTGQTALIVEAELLIALDIQRMLETMGVSHTLFARTAAEAEQLRASGTRIALAVIEICNEKPSTLQLAQGLASAGIPTVFTTAEVGLTPTLARWPGIPVLTKPIAEEAMASAVKTALAHGV